MSLTQFKQVQCFQLGLSDQNGTATFYNPEHAHHPSEYSASGSLLQPKMHLKYSPPVKFKTQVTVSVVTIDSWAKTNDIAHINFMWLDLQGLELNVLKAAEAVLNTVKVIYTEVAFVKAYKNQALYPEPKRWLEAHGFELVATDFTITEASHPSIDRWYGNALFVRR